MIDKKSLENAVGIASALGSKDICVAAVPQSALSHLIGATNHIAIEPTSDDEACTAIRQAAQHIEHDGTMNFIADNAAVSVLNTHRLVTEVVNPHIRKVVATIVEQLAADEAAASTTDHGVELVTIPNVLDNVELENMIARIGTMDRYDVPTLDLGTYTDEEILEQVRYSTSGGYDDVLRMELVNDPEAFNTIRHVLSGKSFGVQKLSKPVAVALLLMSQSLKHSDTIKEGINATLSDYKNRLHWISVTVARYLNATYSSWNAISESKLIYRPTDQNNPSAKTGIISSTFALMADQGVTIEHVVGNNLLDRPYGYHDFIGDKKDETLARTKQAYDRDLATKNSEKESKENDRIIRTALIAIKDEAIDRAGDPANLAILGDTKATMVSRATAACEAVFKSGKTLKHDQIDEFVAGLIIAIYYAHTDALLYLDSIADFTRQYPEMDGPELAKLARVNLITHWVYRQLTTVAQPT